MPLNKFQIKAKVLEVISPIKERFAIDETTVNKTVEALKNIKDADTGFIAKILIKEAANMNQSAAFSTMHVAKIIAPDSYLDTALSELNSPSTSDEAKMLYINILANFGVVFSPSDINSYFENPDEAINNETSRFLNTAKTDPEARVDFLDFYYATDYQDRISLVNSISEDFTGDALANILSPLILSLNDEQTALEYIDILEKTESLFMINPLIELCKYTNFKTLTTKAHKIIQKMTLKGIYTKQANKALYEDLFKDFESPKCTLTPPDGNSNFTMVISRKNKKGFYYLFFAALNIHKGVISCFGFSKVTESEKEKALKRFFPLQNESNISSCEAKALLNILLEKKAPEGIKPPYEYFCWDRIMEDIEPCAMSEYEILTRNLQKIKINELQKKMIFESPFVSNWFYRYSKGESDFNDLIAELSVLREENIDEIENLILKYSKNQTVSNDIKLRILYLAYFLYISDLEGYANLYFTLVEDKELFSEFIKTVLKKSIYECMLTLNLHKENDEKSFTKDNILTKLKFSPKIFLNYIEGNWVV